MQEPGYMPGRQFGPGIRPEVAAPTGVLERVLAKRRAGRGPSRTVAVTPIPRKGQEMTQAGIPLIPILTGLVSLATGATVTESVISGAQVSTATKGGAGMQPGLGAGMVVNGVPISGPGVPEPPRAMVARQWVIKLNADKWAGPGETFYMYFFRLIDGRIMSYHPYLGWKIWRPKKPLAVMYRGKTTLSQAVKVQKYLDQLWRTVARKTKALKLS